MRWGRLEQGEKGRPQWLVISGHQCGRYTWMPKWSDLQCVWTRVRYGKGRSPMSCKSLLMLKCCSSSALHKALPWIPTSFCTGPWKNRLTCKQWQRWLGRTSFSPPRSTSAVQLAPLAFLFLVGGLVLFLDIYIFCFGDPPKLEKTETPNLESLLFPLSGLLERTWWG